MAGCKIVLLIILFHIVNSKPLFKELHIKKDFHVSFKPHEFKPISFVKEKWTHFGHFIAKHTIAKRSPLELAPTPIKSEDPPTFIVALEKSLEAGPSPVLPPLPPSLELVTPAPSMFTPEVSTPAPASVPPSPPPLVSVLPPIYVTEDHLSRLPVEGIDNIVVITPPPAIVMTPILPSPAPPIPAPPSQEPPSPLPPTPLAPVPPPQEVPRPLVQGNLLTDIGRVEEINAYIKAVEGLTPPPIGPSVLPTVSGNSIEEVPKPVADEKLNMSPLVKGSRLALYFGNILLQVMSEVISSARSAISQYSQPAPI